MPEGTCFLNACLQVTSEKHLEWAADRLAERLYNGPREKFFSARMQAIFTDSTDDEKRLQLKEGARVAQWEQLLGHEPICC